MVRLLLLAALLAGLARCWAISRRPTTNRKCVGSLMLLLVAWMVAVAVDWSITSFPALGPLNLALRQLPTAIAIGAALLAVSGLKEYSRSKGYYTQGQGQAFSTLVVSVLLLLLNVAVTFVDLQFDFHRTRHPVGGRPLVFEEWNFKFLAPGSDWAQLETNSLDPKAALTFRCTRPEIHFLIVTQQAPHEKHTVEDLSELTMRNLSNSTDTVRVTYRASTYIAGREGLRVHCEAARAGQKLYYQYRLLVSGGLTYQLITWGADKERTAVAQEADYLAARFTLLGERR